MGKPLTNAEKASEKRARKAEKGGGGVLDELFSGPMDKGMADWGNASPQWVMAVITTMQALGGACTFGLSRDEGAHMLTLLVDGNRKTLWFPQGADLDLELEQLVAQLDTKLQ